VDRNHRERDLRDDARSADDDAHVHADSLLPVT
jgi:hypothetical protein